MARRAQEDGGVTAFRGSHPPLGRTQLRVPGATWANDASANSLSICKLQNHKGRRELAQEPGARG